MSATTIFSSMDEVGESWDSIMSIVNDLSDAEKAGESLYKRGVMPQTFLNSDCVDSRLRQLVDGDSDVPSIFSKAFGDQIDISQMKGMISMVLDGKFDFFQPFITSWNHQWDHSTDSAWDVIFHWILELAVYLSLTKHWLEFSDIVKEKEASMQKMLEKVMTTFKVAVRQKNQQGIFEQLRDKSLSEKEVILKFMTMCGMPEKEKKYMIDNELQKKLLQNFGIDESDLKGADAPSILFPSDSAQQCYVLGQANMEIDTTKTEYSPGKYTHCSEESKEPMPEDVSKNNNEREVNNLTAELNETKSNLKDVVMTAFGSVNSADADQAAIAKARIFTTLSLSNQVELFVGNEMEEHQKDIFGKLDAGQRAKLFLAASSHPLKTSFFEAIADFNCAHFL